MKTVLILLLMTVNVSAINIHNMQITQLNMHTINVSLTTEAVELYYFDSWQYSIAGNVISIQAYFIEGFGSTIAYLNNNFQIPLMVPQDYLVVVRIFYTDIGYTFRMLKDVTRLPFRYTRRKNVFQKTAFAKYQTFLPY